MVADETQIAFIPPYNVSWSTFLNTIEKMASDLPARLDRSYLGSQSGNVQTYLIAAFKTFGLVEEDGTVQPALKELVEADADRPALIAALLTRCYPTLVSLGNTNSTAGQLAEAFSEAFPSLTGESRTKAIRFFLSAAAYSGVKTSPHWKAPKAPSRSNGKPRAPRQRTNSANSGSSSRTPPAGDPPRSRSVNLRSGGTVTLSYSVDLFTLSDEDDEFIRGLISAVRGYGPTTPSPDSTTGSEPSEDGGSDG